MSAAGMEWAYAVIAAHDLDPLAGWIVMHLGWRDRPEMRTDSGIAAALGQHRSSVRGATAKLRALGVIVRLGRQWLAVVDAVPVAAYAAAVPADAGQSVASLDAKLPGQSVARAWPVSGQQSGQSVATKRKRIFEKGKPPVFAPPPRRLPRDRGDVSQALPLGVAALPRIVRDRLLAGQSVVISGALVAPGSPDAEKLVQALRLQEAGELAC